MPAKPKRNNWDDVKILIAAVSVTATLGLWNVFAATDRQNAIAKAVNEAVNQANQQAQTVQQQQPAQNAPAATTANTPQQPQQTQQTAQQPQFSGKILLGGSAPQPVIIRRSNGGGGQPFTRTRSS
jgi:type II secretory pathway pseudopilin PulG